MTKAQMNARDAADAAYYLHLKQHDARRANPAAWYAKLEKLVAAQKAA
jgi:hypothetical protein